MARRTVIGKNDFWISLLVTSDQTQVLVDTNALYGPMPFVSCLTAVVNTFFYYLLPPKLTTNQSPVVSHLLYTFDSSQQTTTHSRCCLPTKAYWCCLWWPLQGLSCICQAILISQEGQIRFIPAVALHATPIWTYMNQMCTCIYLVFCTNKYNLLYTLTQENRVVRIYGIGCTVPLPPQIIISEQSITMTINDTSAVTLQPHYRVIP